MNENKVIRIGYNRYPVSRIIAVEGFISSHIHKFGEQYVATLGASPDDVTGMALTIYLDAKPEQKVIYLCLGEAEEFLAAYDKICPDATKDEQ